jgi:tetratricopeptide (TPR) repeat protein
MPLASSRPPAPHAKGSIRTYLLQVGRWGEVRRHLHRALGNGAKVADLISRSYYLEGAFDDAERCWRQAILWEPDRFCTWWRVGKLELQRGRPGDAIEPLRRAIALQPTAIGPHYTLSLTYRGLGRTEEADRIAKQVNRLRGRSTTPPQGDVDEGIPLESVRGSGWRGRWISDRDTRLALGAGLALKRFARSVTSRTGAARP